MSDTISLLKEGAHSRVYLAEKKGKRLILKAPLSEEDLELLKREWEMSVGLSHPGLANVYMWEDASPVGPCIVEEYVEGRTLAEYLGEGHSLDERKQVFEQLLSVLSYLHKKGVVHNGISPSNILITKENDAVKLLDLDNADDDAHVAEKSLDSVRGYASPELMSGKLTDARSDIWSIGAVMKDLFQGRYGGIVRRCMQSRPSARYASVAALEKAWKGSGRPLKTILYVLLACALGLLVWSYINNWQRLDALSRSNSARETQLQTARHELDSLKRIEFEKEEALTKAKDEVDNWYVAAIPEFREALTAAKTPEDVYAAWALLLNKANTVNVDIPAKAPESVRPAVREYTIQRYNDIFPTLQEEMNAKLQTFPSEQY